MAKIRYLDKTLSADSLSIARMANAIIREYQAEGFRLTLRQLYYQFVARDLIPNTERSYKRLGRIVSDARLAGIIDWEAIEDRTRQLEKLPQWDSVSSILEASARQFRYDAWADQPVRVEVWIEKDALTGVIEQVCRSWQVPFFACRGYSSQSAQWEAGQRFEAYDRDHDQRTIILHLGDHDPSGIDMTRDNKDRLFMFACDRVTVRRLALNYDQVEAYNPPPNPTKLTDSRARDYLQVFGSSCWELDALPPSVIADLVDDAIRAEMDPLAWEGSMQRQQDARDALVNMADQWAENEGDL